MYVSKLNIQINAEAIQKYVEENAFATIVTVVDGEIKATHTPLILKNENNEGVLYGHIARANDQATGFFNGQKATCIFMENHTYISSSWYDHVNVPTWNYIAVHIHGTLTLLDENDTLNSLHELVTKYESASDKPFSIGQMTDKDVKSHLRGLTAFKIKVEKIDASWKLSQNRDDKNYLEIVKRLKTRGDAMSLNIAKEMEKNRVI